jgi:hypothetical protein
MSYECFGAVPEGGKGYVCVSFLPYLKVLVFPLGLF